MCGVKQLFTFQSSHSDFTPNIKNLEAPLEVPGDAAPVNQYRGFSFEFTLNPTNLEASLKIPGYAAPVSTRAHSDFTPNIKNLEARLDVPGDAILVNQHKGPQFDVAPDINLEARLKQFPGEPAHGPPFCFYPGY